MRKGKHARTHGGYNPKVTFEFFAQSGSTWKKRESNMIRGCGVASPSYFQDLLTVL